MKNDLKTPTNYSFGSTSAIITNVSLIVGLSAGEASKPAIIGGILIIALADNFSDSLGIHMYKESENCGLRESFVSTAMNFISRLIISLTFILFILLFPIGQAALFSVIWGLLLLAGISLIIARRNNGHPFTEIVKHIGFAVAVIAASKYTGHLIRYHFR